MKGSAMASKLKFRTRYYMVADSKGIHYVDKKDAPVLFVDRADAEEYCEDDDHVEAVRISVVKVRSK